MMRCIPKKDIEPFRFTGIGWPITRERKLLTQRSAREYSLPDATGHCELTLPVRGNWKWGTVLNGWVHCEFCNTSLLLQHWLITTMRMANDLKKKAGNDVRETSNAKTISTLFGNLRSQELHNQTDYVIHKKFAFRWPQRNKCCTLTFEVCSQKFI